MLAVKSIKPRYHPTGEILRLLETFRRMVSETLQIGLSYDACSLKRLSCLSYRRLKQYGSPSCYKLCAISRAAGILSARKKSLRRGVPTKNPYCIQPQLAVYQGFKVENGALRVAVGKRRFQHIPLTEHSISILSDPTLKVRSFTLTPKSLSISISGEVRDIACTETVGLDRNLRNLTAGNEDRIVHYDLSETVSILEATTQIVGSFKRDDSRIRADRFKVWQAEMKQILQLLQNATKRMVDGAVERGQATVLENIEGIRRIYCERNG